MCALLASLPLLPVFASPVQAQIYVSPTRTILPHLAYGGGWHNRFMSTNYNSTAVTVRLYFYGNDGSALTVPLQEAGGSAIAPTSDLDVALAAYGTRVIETNERRGSALSQGWAVADCGSATCQNVSINGVFATAAMPGPVFEATIFASDSTATNVAFPFDNRDGFVTGVAITARDCMSSNPGVSLALRCADDPANVSYRNVSMMCPEHTSFSLPDLVPASKNRMGQVYVSDD